MRERSDYSFESSSPPDSEDLDVEEEAATTRILWVRIIVLVVFLVAAFGAGFLLAPRESTDARVGDLQAELAQSEQNSQQLEDAQAQVAELEAAATPDTTATQSPSPPEEAKTRTYTVQPGDTLQGIHLIL